MKKLLFHCKRCAVVLLALTAAFAVGCTGDLEDEVADLTGQVEDLESSLAELEDKITDGGITVTSVVTNSDGSKTIYFSDGSVVSTSSSSSSDVEVLADVDEFCVLSIEGTEYVVAKTDYVTLTDVSLKGVTDLYPVMKSGETYDISVKLNPSNTTVVPTAYYLVVVAEGSSSAGVTVKSLMGTESTVVVVDSFTDPDETGTATLSVKWTGADVNSEKVLVSAEFVENTWSNGAVVAVTKEIMTDTSMGIQEGAILITEADVAPGYWDTDDLNTDALKKANRGVLSTHPVQYYMNESSSTAVSIDLDELFLTETDFISYNLKNVQLLYTGDYTADFSASITGDSPEQSVKNWDDSYPTDTTLATISATGTGLGTYSYKDGKATLSFKTPDVEDQTTYSYAIIFDDYYPNTTPDGVLAPTVAEYYGFSGYNSNKASEDYFYSTVLGAVTYTTAPDPIVSRGYVVRYLDIIVNPIEAKSTADYHDYVPHGAAGTDAASILITDTAQEYEYELTVGSTYEITSISATYAAGTGSPYGYFLTSTSGYSDYVKNNPELYVNAAIQGNTVGSSEDLFFAVTMTNTEDYPVLPGKYTFVVTVEATDEDDLATLTTYTKVVYMYVPAYSVGLNANIGDAVSYNTNGDAVTGVENILPVYNETSERYVFSTYEWYDFDLARLIDVDDVKAVFPTVTGDPTTKAYTLVDANIPNSTLYSAYDQFCYDPYSYRMTTGTDYVLDAPKGTSNVWYEGLNVSISGQDEAGYENMILVSEPASASGDVSKTVQFYTTFESGLKLPVDLRVTTAATSVSVGDLLNKGDNGEVIVKIIRNKVSGVTSSIYVLANGDDVEDAEPFDKGDVSDNLYSNFIDYTKDLVSSASADLSNSDMYYINDVVTRTAVTYTNLAKEGLAPVAVSMMNPMFTAGATYLKTWKSLNDLLTDNVTFYSRAYEAAYKGDYSSEFKTYMLAEGYSEATEQVIAKFELYCKENGFTWTIYDSSTVTGEKQGYICSQVGDGSADMFSTVDLFGEDCVVYSVGNLCLNAAGSTTETASLTYPTGLTKSTKLIDLSAGGVIYRATNISTDSVVAGAKVYQKVTAVYTDVFGQSKTGTTYVPIVF